MYINTSNILWKTAGLDWDYRFIIKPESKVIAELFIDYAVFQREIFEEFDILFKQDPVSQVLGCLTSIDGAKTIYFTVYKKQDPTRKDEFGRPIYHYVIYFSPEREQPKDLISPLLSHYNEKIDHIFNSTSEDIAKLEIIRNFQNLVSSDKIAYQNLDANLQMQKTNYQLMTKEQTWGDFQFEWISKMQKSVEDYIFCAYFRSKPFGGKFDIKKLATELHARENDLTLQNIVKNPPHYLLIYVEKTIPQNKSAFDMITNDLRNNNVNQYISNMSYLQAKKAISNIISNSHHSDKLIENIYKNLAKI
jgi:hypothetical protein